MVLSALYVLLLVMLSYLLLPDFLSNFSMKKYILIFSLFLSLIWVHSSYAACAISQGTSAVDLLKDCGNMTTIWVKPGWDNAKWEVQQRIQDMASVAISFWALLAVGAIVWSGIQYTKAYGEDEKLKKAKTTAIYAFIWLILLMASFGLVDIFINFIYKVSAG